LENHSPNGNLNLMELIPVDEPPNGPQLPPRGVPNWLVQNYLVAPPPNAPKLVSNAAPSLTRVIDQETGQIFQSGGGQEFPTGFDKNFISPHGTGFDRVVTPGYPPLPGPAATPPPNGRLKLHVFRRNRGPGGQNPVHTAPQTALESASGARNASGGAQTGVSLAQHVASVAQHGASVAQRVAQHGVSVA
jgi:hypothetical protein